MPGSFETDTRGVTEFNLAYFLDLRFLVKIGTTAFAEAPLER